MAKRVNGVVRVALIGTGGITHPHARGFLHHKDKIQCVALCDIREEAMEARAKQLGTDLPRYKDWKKLLKEMGDEIDAVDICLPHYLHGPAILDAAAAGKHILCEKPMCISLKEADAIERAVKKAGVTYMSGHNQLFMPVVREAKKMIDEGAIGEIRWLRSQDCFRVELNDKNPFRNSWRAKLKTQGGGELIDTGYHPSYRLLYLANSKPTMIRGNLARFMQPIEGDDTASVQVRFANGALGEILTSWAFDNPHGSHQIHVIGEKGQIFGSENTLYYLPTGFSEPSKRTFEPVETFTAEIGHFADALRNGTRPIHSVEEGRAVLELILEAAKGWDKQK
ncbi:MAG TPA: Gfo/Idh/MocA family oxidoreductase [Tepidisphaeraceae bacterium]|jgi:predicted dehydrogenase|nr:Gfo/Idh/MocA family oxidoreductase [Tepidisphaeraceae bacterium]